VRGPVRGVPGGHLRQARRRAPRAGLLVAAHAAARQPCPAGVLDDRLQARRAVLREGPVAMAVASPPPMRIANPHAIDAIDLGVRYSLRFTKKTTIRQSLGQMFSRDTSEPFWALRNVSFGLVRGESLAVIGP